MKEVIDFLLKNREKKCVITFHSHGDIDACASAYAMHVFLPSSTILAPDSPSFKSTKIFQNLGIFSSINIFNKPEVSIINEADFIVFVDMSSYAVSSLGEILKGVEKPKVVIDHHEEESDQIKGINFVNKDYPSTTSIIFDIFENINFQYSKDVAFLLLLGIISDSPELRTASPRTFYQISKLLEKANISFDYAKETIETSISPVSRAEILQEIKNKIEYRVAKGNLFGYGIVGNYISVSYVANLLIANGCDFVIVGAKGKENNRISLRAKVGKNIDLSKIATIYAKRLNGSGGGHKYSSGLYWKEKNEKESLENIIQQLIKEIRLRI
jgi:nanoRNase/pAp phosphatase (c-di-AMP/oligoRNAs hydrolase)